MCTCPAAFRASIRWRWRGGQQRRSCRIGWASGGRPGAVAARPRCTSACARATCWPSARRATPSRCTRRPRSTCCWPAASASRRCWAWRRRRRGATFRLWVFARSREHLAFADALRAPALAPRLRLHLDQGEAAERIDLHALLAERAPGAQLYLCGPGGFMQAVRDAARHWPEDALHAEYFAAPADAEQSAGQPLTPGLAQRGISVPVAADQSAVDALRQVGIDIPVSCQQGLCGSCVVPGDGAGAEHRDFCLTASERQTRLALCCARAKGQELVLQL